MSDEAQPQPQWNPHAAVAGWILPGLGHVILGQKKRGIVIGATILGLWLAGILVGGVSVIDRYDRVEPADDNYPEAPSRSWWFWGQAMIAPSLAVDYLREKLLHKHVDELGHGPVQYGSRHPYRGNPRRTLVPQHSPTDVPPPYEPSFGKVAEQGTLYTALAGMLNLLAMIDVLYWDPRRRSSTAPASAPPITAPPNAAGRAEA